MAKCQKPAIPKIIIIGGGIQGISVALALAKQGVTSTILESQSELMRGASYGNEGKIHLGLVYALDHTGDTGIEMLKGAHSFSPLLDRWCGDLPWHKWKSSGFRYAIMPGSMAEIPVLENYYEQLRTRLPDAIGNLPVKPSYFGKSIEWMWKRSKTTKSSPIVNGNHVPCIDTEEIAIDVQLFSNKLREIVSGKPEITVRPNSRVINVERLNNGFKLEIESAGKTCHLDADVVINCAWTDRIRLDRLASVEIEDTPLSYRIKHRVIVQPLSSDNDLVPVTMVQGPYGDIVPYKNGSIYLSWYPECRTYFNHLPPPAEIYGAETLSAIADRTLTKMSELFPALHSSKILTCSPGVIVAEGTSDVDDPESKLHRRSTSGPRGGNGWWSVDTGKLTLAPLHGEETARLVLQELGIGSGIKYAAG